MSTLGVRDHYLAHGMEPDHATTLSASPPQTVTPLTPGFLAASLLIHNGSSEAGKLHDSAPTVMDVTAKRHGKSTKARSGSSKGERVKRKSQKSAEYVVDSDDSDAVPLIQSYRALGRRQNWTPVMDDTVSPSANSTQPTSNFANLIGSFQYERIDRMDPPPGAASLAPTVVAKAAAPRRSSKKNAKAKEAVKTPKPAKDPKTKTVTVKVPRVPKAKKPKSKVQTITALAIAPYRPPAESGPAQTTILEALASHQVPAAPPEAAPTTATKRKRKVTTSGSTKSRKVNKITVTKNRSPLRDLPPRNLLAPVQATNTLANQVFIFGTSSQLHAEESVQTLTHIQQAIQESEFSPGSVNVTPEQKSRARVPTAPHGTSLTNGQAYRDLWCVSARDHAGGTLAGEEDTQISLVDSVLGPAADDEAPLMETMKTEAASTMDDNAELPIMAAADPPLPEDDELPVLLHDDCVSEQLVEDGNKRVQDHNHEPDHNSFISLSSDPPPAEPATMLQDRPPASMDIVPPWPSTQRGILQPLDANRSIISPLRNKANSQQFRAASRKVSPEPSLTKGRGRPPNSSSGKQEIVVISSSSPIALIETHKQRRSITSPSKILATLQSSPPSEWHNIDEISDSEGPPTPSPPRKQASPSQPDVALDFDADEAVEPQPAAPTISKDDPQWPVVFAKLFPRITATVKAVPRSDSLTTPNWHEKMLLYDPIVIEDLTNWLNTQGLRVTVRQKFRKKKAVLDPEQDHVEEELSHWMVQKWCEENSICCLWKEGLRGGVRTRY